MVVGCQPLGGGSMRWIKDTVSGLPSPHDAAARNNVAKVCSSRSFPRMQLQHNFSCGLFRASHSPSYHCWWSPTGDGCGELHVDGGIHCIASERLTRVTLYLVLEDLAYPFFAHLRAFLLTPMMFTMSHEDSILL